MRFFLGNYFFRLKLIKQHNFMLDTKSESLFYTSQRPLEFPWSHIQIQIRNQIHIRSYLVNDLYITYHFVLSHQLNHIYSQADTKYCFAKPTLIPTSIFKDFSLLPINETKFIAKLIQNTVYLRFSENFSARGFVNNSTHSTNKFNSRKAYAHLTLCSCSIDFKY